MRPAEWDALADDFDADVFDPVGTDLRGAIPRALRRAGRVARAADFGCGTGRLLPLLRRRAEHVTGRDFAPRLLEAARRRVGDDPAVTLRRADLTRPLRAPRGLDLVTCVNALLTPDPAAARTWLRNLHHALRPGGALLLVVPALESALWVNARLIAWNERDGLRGARALRGGLGTDAAAARDLLRGVVDQGGVRTRHFLREDLEARAGDAGFTGLRFDRVEYPWDAYFEAPPAWLGAPLPWDWLLFARRG